MWSKRGRPPFQPLPQQTFHDLERRRTLTDGSIDTGSTVPDIQRGKVTTDAGTGLATVTFPHAFPAAPIVTLGVVGDYSTAVIVSVSATQLVVKTRLMRTQAATEAAHTHSVTPAAGSAHSHSMNVATTEESSHTHTNPTTGGPSATTSVSQVNHAHGSATGASAPDNPHSHSIDLNTTSIAVGSDVHTHTQAATGAGSAHSHAVNSTTNTESAHTHGTSTSGAGSSHNHDVTPAILSAVVHWIAVEA